MQQNPELEKLKTGLLLQGLKRKVDEAAYDVIGQVTFGHQVELDRHSYAEEIVRILREMRITTSLLEQVDVDVDLDEYSSEDLLNYYVGVYLGLVHQLKDKLFRLLDYSFADEKTKIKYKEPKRVSNIPKKHKKTLERYGLLDLVAAWNQENSGSIGTSLRKRTQHHHNKSRLQLNEDFQNIKMAKTMLSPEPSKSFNQTGIDYLSNIKSSSAKKLKEELLKHQNTTYKAITENIEELSEKLVSALDLPTDDKRRVEIMTEYMEYLDQLKIENRASKEKISDHVKQILELIKNMFDESGGQIKAIYGVGSVFRDEFIPGKSDLNLIVVTKGYSKSFDTEIPATLEVISEDDFKSASRKKERFICWSDGVCLHGEEFDFDKNGFPKPGTELCVLLNDGFIERLEGIKNQVMVNKDLTGLDLRLLSLKAAKIMLDYSFGVAMSNQPYYSSSRADKISHIRKVFPSLPITETIVKVYEGAIVSPEDLTKLIEVYLEQARKNYEKQIKVIRQFDEKSDLKDKN